MDIKLKQIQNNFSVITVDNAKIYFSYETPVAFSANGMIEVIQNYWGSTTGKHLNQLQPNKLLRITQDELRELMDKHFT